MRRDKKTLRSTIDKTASCSFVLMSLIVLLNFLMSFRIADDTIKVVDWVFGSIVYMTVFVFGLIVGIGWGKYTWIKMASMIYLVLLTGFPAIGLGLVIALTGGYDVPISLGICQIVFLVCLLWCWCISIYVQWHQTNDSRVDA